MGGHCYFVDAKGKETKAEFTIGYIKDPSISDRLRINLHHSSIPFTYASTGIVYYGLRFIIVAILLFGVGSIVLALRVKTSATTSFLARWIIAVRQLQRSLKQMLGFKKKGGLPIVSGDIIGKGV